jgi:hypothetical protein
MLQGGGAGMPVQPAPANVRLLSDVMANGQMHAKNSSVICAAGTASAQDTLGTDQSKYFAAVVV